MNETDPTDYARDCECGERNKVMGEGLCAICFRYRDNERRQRILTQIARAPRPDGESPATLEQVLEAAFYA